MSRVSTDSTGHPNMIQALQYHRYTMRSKAIGIALFNMERDIGFELQRFESKTGFCLHFY
jgi:hypothetical protein